MGSSAISAIIKGQTGSVGPKGPSGSVGATGVGSGLTGNTGSSGVYISNIFSTIDSTIITKNDNTSPFIAYATRGPTGYTGTMYGENQGTGLTLYTAINGFTLSVRGLSFTGNLSAEVTGGTILVVPADIFYGTTFAAGITNNRVVYSVSSSVIDSSRIQLGKTYNNFAFSFTDGITSGSLPVYSEISGNVIDVPSGGNDVILGLTQGSIYYIHTPIGLSGFSLNSSSYGNNELISFTIFVEGSGFTQFPPNVYFENTPYSSVFGCGVNIMNLMTYDKGQNWFATIADRGYGVQACAQDEGVGSCCYVGASGDRECVEYVSQDWCNQKPSSIFSLMTACDPLCGKTAICCSNGTCVGGVSKEECEYFLGKYYENISCSSYENPDRGDNSQRLCYDVTQPSYSCCTGGTCIDQVTALLCVEYYGGNPVSGSCCDISCETLQPIRGACCVRNGTPSCSIKTPVECQTLNGVFYGDGTTCSGPNGVNCCFDVVERGTCCTEVMGCVPYLTRDECTLLNGGNQNNWYQTRQECDNACISNPPLGSCCIPNVGCLPEIIESDCDQSGGTSWYPDQNCNGECQ